MKRSEGRKPEKQPLSADELPINSYYESVSERFGIAQVLLYLALLAFVAISFLSNTGLITYQNLYYFIKDLGASAENVDVMHSDSISYTADASQSFTLYRRGLAVAGNTSVTVFTANGRQTVSENIQYQNPVAVGSGKYLLVYELGGNRYSLYNSYTQIHSGKTDAVIRGADMSDSGMYAIITQSNEFPSVVELYNADFAMIGQYPSRSYVTDVALHPKGSYLSLLTADSDGGRYVTSLQIYEPGKKEKKAELPLGNSLGIRCSFTDAGQIAVLSGGGIYFASVQGKLQAEYDFAGQSIHCADINSAGCAVILKKSVNSKENIAIVFDKSGKMLYNNEVVGSFDSIAACNGALFLTEANGILRIQLSNGELSRLECQTERRALLAVDDTRVLLCSPQKAETYRFSA